MLTVTDSKLAFVNCNLGKLELWEVCLEWWCNCSSNYSRNIVFISVKCNYPHWCCHSGQSAAKTKGRKCKCLGKGATVWIAADEKKHGECKSDGMVIASLDFTGGRLSTFAACRAQFPPSCHSCCPLNQHPFTKTSTRRAMCWQPHWKYFNNSSIVGLHELFGGGLHPPSASRVAFKLNEYAS